MQQDILVGTMLGDCERAKNNHSPRLRFDQTFPNHAFYLTILYVHFINLVGKHPTVHTRKPDIRTGMVYSTIRFSTLAFPCFKYFYDM